MEFSTIIKGLVEQNSRIAIHQAVVQASVVGPPATLTIRLSGDTTDLTGIRYLASYKPKVNDVVFCIINAGDIFVIGKTNTNEEMIYPVAYRTTAYTVTKDLNTYVPFEAASTDQFGMWASGSPTVLTCKVAGRYQATGSILFTGQNNSYVSIFIEKNTQEIARQDGTMSTKEHGYHMSVTSLPFTMAVDDTVRLGVHHDYNPTNDLILSSGGIDHTGFFNALGVIYLGP